MPFSRNLYKRALFTVLSRIPFSCTFILDYYPSTQYLISSYTLLKMQGLYSCYNLQVSASAADFPGITFDILFPTS